MLDKIKDKIEEVVNKLKGDKDLLSKFKSDPIKTVESIIGVDLPDEAIEKVVDGVKAKLASGDIADKVDDVKDAIGGFLGKFKK